MNRVLCFMLVANCLAADAAAQSPNVSGIVIDDRTEEPLKGVLIYVENQSSFTETDASGRFAVMIPRAGRLSPHR